MFTLYWIAILYSMNSYLISMFVYIRTHFRFGLTGGNLTAESMGSHRGIGGGIQVPET